MKHITKAVVFAVLVSCPMGIPESLELCAVAHPVQVGWGCVELQSIVVKIMGLHLPAM